MNLILYALALGIAALVEGLRFKALRGYFSRPCQGRAWKRAFPQSRAVEIRSFLDVVTRSFGFRRKRALAFSPDDSLLGIYRACYPIQGLADSLELETFAREIEQKYGLDLVKVWSAGLTLGEVFRQIRATS